MCSNVSIKSKTQSAIDFDDKCNVDYVNDFDFLIYVYLSTYGGLLSQAFSSQTMSKPPVPRDVFNPKAS